MILPIALVILVVVGLTLPILYHRLSIQRWLKSPLPPGHLVDIDGQKWYVTVKGAGTFTVLIETRLGGPSPEWWSIQDRLAAYARVVTYDRAGYGWSSSTSLPRTGERIAGELHTVLTTLHMNGPYVLVGHSQGGLYMQHFARLYAKEIAGCVFIDPLTHEDNRFEQELSPRIYQRSGVNKLPAIRTAHLLVQLGLMSLLKPLMLKSPPFSYYKGFSSDLIELLWQYHQRAEFYRIIIDEYEHAHCEDNTRQLLSKPFPTVPVTVLYHNASVIIDEIVQYGGLNIDEAQQVETLWEHLTRSYLQLSSESNWIALDKSSHFAYLDQSDRVVTAITDVLIALENQRRSIDIQ